MLLNEVKKSKVPVPEWATELDDKFRRVLDRLDFSIKGPTPFHSGKQGSMWEFGGTLVRTSKDDLLDEDTLLDGVAVETAKFLHDLAKSGRIVQVVDRREWRPDDVHQVQPATPLNSTIDYVRGTLKRYARYGGGFYYQVCWRVEDPPVFQPEAPLGVKKVIRVKKGSA